MKHLKVGGLIFTVSKSKKDWTWSEKTDSGTRVDHLFSVTTRRLDENSTPFTRVCMGPFTLSIGHIGRTKK